MYHGGSVGRSDVPLLQLDPVNVLEEAVSSDGILVLHAAQPDGRVPLQQLRGRGGGGGVIMVLILQSVGS